MCRRQEISSCTGYGKELEIKNYRKDFNQKTKKYEKNGN